MNIIFSTLNVVLVYFCFIDVIIDNFFQFKYFKNYYFGNILIGFKYFSFITKCNVSSVAIMKQNNQFV